MNNIAKARKAKKLTLKGLEALTGIKDNTISQYETNKREPNLKRWNLLSQALGVSVPYLQGIIDTPTPIDETVLEISGYIKKVIKDPRVFNENEWLALNHFLNLLISATSFSGASDLLRDISSSLDALTDTETPEDAQKVDQIKLINQFKKLLEIINNGWENM